MLEAVRRAVAIKAGVVSRDPHETGERAILNYGHTVGHALERAAGFGRLRHGEAVAWGMEVAGRLSLSSGAGTPEAVRTQHALLQRAGLLANRPEVKRADLWQALRHDKKSQAGALRFVLLREIGRADYGCEVDPNLVWDTLAKVLSPRFTVIAPDLPGIGDSSIPKTGIDMKTSAERVHAAVRSLGYSKVRVVGSAASLSCRSRASPTRPL